MTNEPNDPTETEDEDDDAGAQVPLEGGPLNPSAGRAHREAIGAAPIDERRKDADYNRIQALIAGQARSGVVVKPGGG